MYRRSDLDADLLRLIDLLGGDVSDWPDDSNRAGDLIGLARSHRVDGLIDELARTGQILLEKSAAVELAGASLAAKHRQSVKDSDLAAMLESLDDLDVGLEVMVLKGWWTSQTAYTERADRRYSDLDIWISPRSSTSAGTVAQFLQKANRPSASAYDTMLDGNLMHNAGISFNGGLVEVHKNPYGLKVDPCGLRRLWDTHARRIKFADREVFVPSVELALLIACVNYTRDCFPQLYQLIDAYRLAQSDELVWDEFWSLCEEQGLDQFARGALTLVSCLFQVPMVPGAGSVRRWRSWWTSTNHVLRGDAPAAARLPAQLLARNGSRNVIAVAAQWLCPPAELWEVFGRTYRYEPQYSYARNAINLQRVRFGAAMGRYRRPN